MLLAYLIEPRDFGKEVTRSQEVAYHAKRGALKPAWMLKRILLIEDDVELNELLQLVLEPLGHEVIGVCNVGDALKIESETGHFDLIIADEGLPDGSGSAFALDYIARCKGSQLLIISGYHPSFVGLPDRDPPFVFMQKPFASSALVFSVETMLS